ncbi:hypothetical protein [Lysobacter antibioticus]|uniref:Uncharacterized protein n=1 Tax=Lysobacter antibioticus TaxID=84531 RepID=A0A0S2F7F6_LYSAN|nr:hypothetical protein [Lysobacter antibioticus]ALN79478.1 hypothetical protein LA76x_1321 [Lysobacter antibioticus]
MSPVDNPKVATRRARLQAWIDQHHGGKQADFVRAHNLNQGEISLLLKNKSFGEKRAAALEKAAGMPAGYLSSEADDESHESSQLGRPDPATLRRAMRLLSFVSHIQGVQFVISDENTDMLLMAYDVVSLSPSDFDLEDASTRMSEWLRARGQNEQMVGREAVGTRRKALGRD